MIINPYVFGSADETPGGEQLFWWIGDSNADGRGTTVPTVGSNILYNWNGSSYDMITTQAIDNDTDPGDDYGGSYQYFATAYNTTFGKKILLVNSAKGGSAFYADGGDHWSGSGALDLYQPAKTVVLAALANKGLTKPKGIILNCSINDEIAGTSAANYGTAAQTLLTNLATDFPGVPVLVMIPGGNGSSNLSTSLYTLRRTIIDLIEANANAYPLMTGCQFIENAFMNGDNLHYANSGLQMWGNAINRWFINSAITNKWARFVVSSHFDELSANRKTLTANFITTQYNNGNWFKLEHLGSGRTTAVQNLGFDWTGLGYMFRTSAGFSANTSISSNGTSSYFTSTFRPDISIRAASPTDFIYGGYLITKSTANGTAGTMTGGSNGTASVAIGQTTTASIYRANDLTNSVGTEAGLAAGNVYSVFRNGTTKGLIKGTTIDASVTQASTGTENLFLRIGANTNNPTINSFFGGTYGFWYAAKYSTFDLSGFLDGTGGFMYLMDHWND